MFAYLDYMFSDQNNKNVVFFLTEFKNNLQ